MAKAVHNLPKFKDNAPFPRPDRPREWVEQQGSLKRLGLSLLVDDEPFADPDEPIRAIPDPWAQARTFAEALVDEEHSMHAYFLAQWRGLLGLIGLRRLCAADYTLDTRAVSLEGNHIFNRVLSRLSPRIALGNNFDLWTRPAIVYATPAGGRQMPLAMMNPACLVSPGRLASQISLPNIPWARKGLRDPLELTGDESLPAAYLVALGAYVENLRSKLGQLPASAAGDAIRQRLQEFDDEIDAVLGVSALSAKVGQGFNPDLEPAYQSLWSTVELEKVDNPAATSECRLALKPGGGRGGLKGVILVDESLGKTGGKSGRDILVWGTRTLSELLASKPKFDDVAREAAEHGYLLITADDLFTPRAVRLGRKPKIPGHPLALKDIIIPIRPLVLLLDGTMPGMIDADSDSNRCSVTLKLKLEHDGGNVPHSLTRHYRDEATDSKALLVTDAFWALVNATVWPDFKTPAWTNYFARFYYPTDNSQVRPKRALSRQIIEAALALTTDHGEAVLTLSRINSGLGPDPGESWFQQSEVVAGVTRDVIQASDRGFEAIFYSDFDEDRGEAEAGCIWLDVKAAETRPYETEVAVDFGTTNTVACFKDRKPIELQQRLLHPISFDEGSSIQNQRETYRWQFVDFMPPDRRELPTPTVAITREGKTHETKISIFRNVIYFSPAATVLRYGAEFEGEKYRAFFSRSMFNLKWSDDEAHRQAASDFLEQLMMMIAAEAVAKGSDPRRLKWRFSLPDSMPDKSRRAFQGHLDILSRTISPEGHLDGLYSEGMAAAKYMLAGNSGANVTPGTIDVIMDIGGGTTDVTIWSHDDPLWRGSFRVAGQAFFTQTIVQNPAILQMIGLTEWASLFEPPEDSVRIPGYQGIAPHDVVHLAEVLFSGRALTKAMDENWSLKLNLKAGETLRTAALVFIGGIAYYLGTVVRQLIADEVISSEKLANPTFSLCGRGAGIFARIHGRLAPNGDSDVTRALALFSHAARAEGTPRPRLFLEPESKLEVVRGMVTDYANIDAHVETKKEPASAHLPAGISLQFQGGDELDQSQSIRDEREAKKVASVDISAIEDMLDKLESETSIEVNIRKADTEGAHAMIRNEVRAHVDRAQEEGMMALDEPPFITALRALVGEIAKSETDATRRINIQVKP